MDMNKLMRPKSLVVIGASDKVGMVGGATKSSIKGANKDHVYYINPKRDEVNGRKCYHSLAELPEVPECMLLCTPAKTIAGYLEEGGKMGVGAAVVLASGFSEERSAEAQALSDEVKEICLKYDIALCGPNCIGIVNGIDNVCVTANNDDTLSLLEDDNRRGLGIVAQSGYISSGFNYPDCDFLAFIVSAGNSIICGLEDYMLYFAKEPRINAIAAYIEGIRKPDVLEEALRIAAENRKPVIVLKAGSSAKGGFAAASHTGSLAGNYRSIQSILEKYGVIFTRNLQELTSTARMFAVLDGNFPKKATMGGVNFSGGENTLCADTSERVGIPLPDFAEKTIETIKTVVPPFATPANPLDATTNLFREKEKVETLFRCVSEDPSIGLMAVGTDVGIPSEAKDFTCAEVLSEMSKRGEILPTVIIPSFEKPRNPDVRIPLEKAGIPVLSSGIYAYDAIRHLLDFVEYDYSKITPELAIPDAAKTTATKEEKEAAAARKGKHTLSESESKEALSKEGVPVPAQTLIKSDAELEEAIKNFSYPCVMKIDSEDIPHKTEAGGVKLNIQNAGEAEEAYFQIIESCKAYKPEAKVNGVMMQEMVSGKLEVLIGITCDPLFGPLLLCGMGGIYAELFKDTALCPCPLNKDEAMKMLKSLKIWPMFEGWRGAPALDADALADLMVSVSNYAVAHKNDLAELDLNPVFVREKGKGVCAADALIVLKD